MLSGTEGLLLTSISYFPIKCMGTLKVAAEVARESTTKFYTWNYIETAFFKAFNEVMGSISAASHLGMSGLIFTSHLSDY